MPDCVIDNTNGKKQWKSMASKNEQAFLPSHFGNEKERKKI